MDVSNITDDQIQEVVNQFAKVGTLRSMKGISNAEMEAIYSMGVTHYRAGNYDNAEKIFRFLCLFEHTSSRYWTAMGSVYQIKRNFAKAIQAYAFATFLDIRNPKPYYYLAQCHQALGNAEDALVALDGLDEYAPTDTEAGRKMRAKGKELRARLAK